ncbi:MAG: EAL domain-containing protein [Gammaproteobacteria bacterium]|nr:EAL domain-containing protein [Gammaproteobacteria bacterium]
MTKIKTYNLNLWLPVIVSCLAVSLFLFQSVLNYRETINQVYTLNSNHLKQTAWRMSRTLEYNLANNAIDEAKREISLFNLDDQAVFAVLVSSDFTIELASSFAWQGKNIKDIVPDVYDTLDDYVSNKHQTVNHLSDNKITAIVPVASAPTSSEIRPTKQHFLILQSDVTAELNRSLSVTAYHSIPTLVILSVFILVLIALIRRFVLTPIRLLGRLAQDFAQNKVLANPFSGKTIQTDVAQALVDAGNRVRQQLIDLQDKEQRLSITLDSIGDAVIVTDQNGYITRLNNIASTLTGWSQQQALVQALPTVFDIYDASTNEKVANPVEQVLATKQIVELGNHTVLRSKTGELFHILYSAAPIHYSNNQSEDIHGIILVFQNITERKRIEQALTDERSLLQGIIDSTPDLIFCKDKDGVFIRCNKAFEKFFGANESDILGKTDFDFVDKETAQFFRDKDKAMMEKNMAQINEEQVTYPDGHTVLLETLKTPLKTESNANAGLLGISRDITQQRQTEHALQITGQVFEATKEGICVTDSSNTIIQVNPAFTTITGFSADEVIGKKPNILSSGLQDSEYYKNLWNTLHTKGAWSGELYNRRKNGEIYPQWSSISTVKDETGAIQKHIAIMSDISDAKEAQQHIEFLAQHDVLTKLPNRALLNDRIGQAIVTAERQHKPLALLFLDLDRFKFVNDSLGHAMGDKLLIELANILLTNVRKEDTVSRTGGDEFTILLVDTNIEGAAHVAQNLIDAISHPFTIDNHQLFVTLSIGISLYPDNGETEQILSQKADTAMYRAKQNGRNQYQFFTEEMHAQMLEKFEFEKELRFAQERGQLELVYQPQLDLETAKIIGCEALIRWNHPQKGYISPTIFIPIAEESGLINAIGDWVLNTAIQQIKQWNELGYNDLLVAVNLSGIQFNDVGLVDRVQTLLQKNQVSAHNLELEITESIAMQDIDLTITQLQNLANLGIKLSLDDFGTGYSSLSYLKKFPIHKLKIDQSFIFTMLEDKDNEAIVDAVITLAKSLRLETIAEGVETKAQFDSLKNKNCDQMQGYYFSKPIPSEQFVLLLASQDQDNAQI